MPHVRVACSGALLQEAGLWTGVRLCDVPINGLFPPTPAVWTGVRLRDVLQAAGLQDDDPNVNHIQVGTLHYLRVFAQAV